MLKVYCCFNCIKTTYLQFENNLNCKICNTKMNKLRISFEDYTNLNPIKREKYINNYIIRKKQPPNSCPD